MNSKAFSVKSPKPREGELLEHKAAGISDLNITEALVSANGEQLILTPERGKVTEPMRVTVNWRSLMK